MFRQIDSTELLGQPKLICKKRVVLKKIVVCTTTLESGINLGVGLLIFEKSWRKKRLKNNPNALINVKINQNSDV